METVKAFPTDLPVDVLDQKSGDARYLKLDNVTTPQIITATDTDITASDEVYFGDVTDSSKIKKDTVQGILDLVPASASAHTDLTDMPDSSGTNTDHDTRYVTKVQSGEPSTPAPFTGMLWLDPSETAVDTTDHAELSNLDYAGSGHTGFEPAITAGTAAQFLKGDKSLGTTPMDLIETATPSGASSITFSGLTTGVRYLIIFNVTQNTSTAYYKITFNADTGNNYNNWGFNSDSSALVKSGNASFSAIAFGNSVATSNMFASIVFSSAETNHVRTLIASSYTGAAGQSSQNSGGDYAGGAGLSSMTITASAGTMTGTAKLYRLN